MARQFYRDLGKHYGRDEEWKFEPAAAQKIIDGYAKDAGVGIHFRQYLDSVEMKGQRIVAVRMLGDMVDHAFDTQTGAPVRPGLVLGWIEGFKAISDLFCVAAGTFAGPNPLLQERIQVVNKDPYGAGWLYRVDGNPDSRCMDVEAYRDLLDKTIDRILEKQKAEEIQ